MLALILAVLAAVAGLPSGGMVDFAGAEPGSVEAIVVEGAQVAVAASQVPCCETEAEGPCGPGDSCPPFGGCCACVACCKRVADAPPAVAPVAVPSQGVRRIPTGESSGIDGGGAVWHPPRD